MPLTHIIIIHIVGGSNLHLTGSKFHINILIGKNRNFSSNDWQNNFFPNKLFKSFIIWIDRNSRIAEHCLGTSSCNSDNLAAVFNRILEIPKLSVYCFVNYFFIRDCRFVCGIPIHHSVAAVYFAVVVKLNKRFDNFFVIVIIHREAFSLPVTANTKFFLLLTNYSAVFFFPFPAMLNKFIAPD